MSDFNIKKLTWDSIFFGYEIGKIEINNCLNNEEILNSIKKSPFEMVQLFSNKKLESSYKYNPIDVKLTYSKKVPKYTTSNNFIKSVNKDFEDSLVKLSKEAGVYSRYKSDKNLSFKFEEMYEIWMNKSLKRKLASEVFAYQIKKKIIGMITVKQQLKNAEIGLVAVDNKLQSKGIGRQLLQTAENWALKQNLENIFVTTQEENYKACDFYKNNKYIIYNKTYIYHIWKNL
jgi:dTDP-4-amino-4,6-dideoxy-D-galactose acyltransferase